jgi:hypothetical protein
MDKAKVISAYLNGYITLRECEQILGMEAGFILGMIRDRLRADRERETYPRSAP